MEENSFSEPSDCEITFLYMLLQLTCDFLFCLCLEGDENGQEQDGHAGKRSAEEEEVSGSVRVTAVRRN